MTWPEPKILPTRFMAREMEPLKKDGQNADSNLQAPLVFNCHTQMPNSASGGTPLPQMSYRSFTGGLRTRQAKALEAFSLVGQQPDKSNRGPTDLKSSSFLACTAQTHLLALPGNLLRHLLPSRAVCGCLTEIPRKCCERSLLGSRPA